MITNKETYINNQKSWIDLPVFFRPWYLNSVCGEDNWDVCISKDKGGSVQGVLPYFKTSKMGFSHITMPLLAPYLGPWLIYPSNLEKVVSKYAFEKKVITNLLDQIPSVALIKMHCHPSLQNVLPAYWNGYDSLVRYTYLIKKANEDTLWKEMDAKQRNVISSSKGNFTVEKTEDIKTFYELNKKGYERDGGSIPYNLSYLKDLFRVLRNNNSGKILICKDLHNAIHAGVLLASDQNSTYCLAIGNDPKNKNSGAMSYLMWKAISISLKKTEQFNFEGGMIPNIEKFFRSFGGKLTPYYRLQRARSKFEKGIYTLFNKM